MDKKNETPFIMDLMRNFLTIFALSVLAISFAGLLITWYAPGASDISALFVHGGIGIPYHVILQIAGFSLVLACFSILIISDRFIIKMQFWLRIILLFIAALITFSIFIIIFKWFPVNDILACVGFFISTFICFIFSLGLTFLKFKLEGKKYNNLLAKYKEAHNK